MSHRLQAQPSVRFLMSLGAGWMDHGSTIRSTRPSSITMSRNIYIYTRTLFHFYFYFYICSMLLNFPCSIPYSHPYSRIPRNRLARLARLLHVHLARLCSHQRSHSTACPCVPKPCGDYCAQDVEHWLLPRPSSGRSGVDERS